LNRKNSSKISSTKTSLGLGLGIPSLKYSRGPRKSELRCGSSSSTPMESVLGLPSEPNFLEEMGTVKKPKPMQGAPWAWASMLELQSSTCLCPSSVSRPIFHL